MVGAWAIVFVMLIVVQFKLLTARIPKLTTSKAIDLVNKQNGVFVDIRSSDLFSQGHIVKSINMLPKDIKEAKLNRIDSSRNKPVIIVGKDKYDGECFNCSRALKKHGFTQVFILDGGILEWMNANLPLSNKK